MNMPEQTLRMTVIVGVVGGLLAMPAVTFSQPSAADEARTTAVDATTRGDGITAASQWSLAARLFSEAGRGRDQAQALVALAAAQQSSGDYEHAEQSLLTAQSIVTDAGDAPVQATVLAALGNLYITLRPTLAEDALREALEAAERSALSGHAASILNNLGNVLAAEGRDDEALDAYQMSAARADRAGDTSVSTRAWINRARVALRGARWQDAEVSLRRARALTEDAPSSHDAAYDLTSIGQAMTQLADSPTALATTLTDAAEALQRATVLAETIDDPLAASYARGYLGAVYERQGRLDDALQTTRRALFVGAQAQSRYGPFGAGIADEGTGVSAAVGNALYQWHWQAARIFRAQGDLVAAIGAGRDAVDILEDIRFELATGYATGRESFRQRVEPVYFFLVEMLFERSEQVSEHERNALLVEARRQVEGLKAAELRDYFDDDCVDALLSTGREASQVDAGAVIVYPILLEDRIELLVDAAAANGLERVPVGVSRAKVTAVIKDFRRFLENSVSVDYLEPAAQLYEWLIRPIRPYLDAGSVSTLVFVPDGPLRLVPMGALMDAETGQFLIEQFALATIPALNLIDPRPLERDELRVLLTGLSEQFDQFVALPYVAQELEQVRDLYPEGELLLNGGFTRDRLRQTLAENEFSVVHVASHGEFRGEAEEAFLLTQDGRLPMNDLATYIAALRFRGLEEAGGDATSALELLVLSACETAQGDERAALGLAGVAIKAGARSAVGTLWKVNDRAASQLVVEFYRQLGDTSLSKAQALQRAQMALAAPGSSFDHPKFWAPFLLISNWL